MEAILRHPRNCHLPEISSIWARTGFPPSTFWCKDSSSDEDFGLIRVDWG